MEKLERVVALVALLLFIGLGIVFLGPIFFAASQAAIKDPISALIALGYAVGFLWLGLRFRRRR